MGKSCCGLDAVWVDNVPGKEYWYCKECKNEILYDFKGLAKEVYSPAELPKDSGLVIFDWSKSRYNPFTGKTEVEGTNPDGSTVWIEADTFISASRS